MDISLDQTTLSKNLICDTKKFDTSKNIKPEDVPVIGSEEIIRTMKDKRHISVAIEKMAIENQVFESWVECLEQLDKKYITEQMQDANKLSGLIKKSGEEASK